MPATPVTSAPGSPSRRQDSFSASSASFIWAAPEQRSEYRGSGEGNEDRERQPLDCGHAESVATRAAASELNLFPGSLDAPHGQAGSQTQDADEQQTGRKGIGESSIIS